jgi:hypothetical protein
MIALLWRPKFNINPEIRHSGEFLRVFKETQPDYFEGKVGATGLFSGHLVEISLRPGDMSLFASAGLIESHLVTALMDTFGADFFDRFMGYTH